MARSSVTEAADRELVATARNLHLLGAISWPEQLIHQFLDDWSRGNPRLPEPSPPAPAPEETIRTLERLARTPATDSLGAFVAETAQSYFRACQLVQGAGTSAGFTASCALFGLPSEPLPGSSISHREAAERLLDVTAPLEAATREGEADYCVTVQGVAEYMQEKFEAFFGDVAPEIVIDKSLSAKAAASAVRVRLRAATCFSEEDARQLVEHEGFVHAATSLNGRRQPHLTSLSLSAPRTTATQEGLATLAELVTGSMDLARLRRLALRVVATDLAVAGADFIEVFRYFLEQGQSESESAYSAARIFRSGDVRGRHVFTKDVVYLRGLFAVHTFLRAAIADGRPELVRRLFVGRLTLNDVLRLEPHFEDGTIAAPAFVPRWAARVRPLAAYLSFSALLNRIDMSKIDLDALWGAS